MDLESTTSNNAPQWNEKSGEQMVHDVAVLGHNLDKTKEQIWDATRRVIFYIDSPGFDHGVLVVPVRLELIKLMDDRNAQLTPSEHALISIVYPEEVGLLEVRDDILQLLFKDPKSVFVEFKKNS